MVTPKLLIRVFSYILLFAMIGCSFKSCSNNDNVIWKDGPFRLEDYDMPSFTILCYQNGEYPNGVYRQLVGDKVCAVGSNVNYIVAMQPADGKRLSDPKNQTLSYYYIKRQPILINKFEAKFEVHGPLTFIEFNKEKSRLGLPSFSYYYTTAYQTAAHAPA